jgi:predicted porin
MSATPNPIGIKSAQGYTLCQSYDRTLKLQKIVPLFDYQGKNVKNDGFDPVSMINLKGEGDLPDGLVALTVLTAGTDITGLSGGKLVISSTDETWNADKRNEWSATLKHLPAAS